jgi:hypothetical protein
MMEIVWQYSNWSSTDISNKELILIIEYFRFCSEFYVWYKKWRISEEIWITRKNDMIFYLFISQILDVIIWEIQVPGQFYWLFDDELSFVLEKLNYSEL